MPFVIVCGGCKRKLRIRDNLLGKTVQCPQCARKLKIVAKPKVAAVRSAQSKAGPKISPPATAARKTPTVNALPLVAADQKTPKANAPGRAKATPTAVSKPVQKPQPAAPSDTPRAANPNNGQQPPRSQPKVVTPGKSGNRFFLYLAIGVIFVLLLGGGWYWFSRGGRSGPVAGTVNLNGQPLMEAVVVFEGEDDPKLGRFEKVTDENGKYELRGPNGSELPAGKYKVYISKVVQEVELLPPDYSDPAKTILRKVVPGGTNEFDFQLSRP